MHPEPPANLRELSEILWRERHLLDVLHFKLEVERLLLQSNRNQWIGHVGREIESVVDELGQVELERAVIVAHVGEQLGVGREPSLGAVVDVAPAPWNALLQGHRDALAAAAGDVRRIADENAERLRDAVAATRRALIRISGDDW